MTFKEILRITEFPYKVRLNSNYCKNVGFNADMIVSINSYKHLEDNCYELYLSANIEDMEHNMLVSDKDWYNEVSDTYDKNIFQKFPVYFDSEDNFHITEYIDGDIDQFDHYDIDGLSFDLESSKILYSLFKNSFIADINPQTKKVVDRILKFGETL